MRQAIARHYGLDDRTGIVLTASGTDAELIALAMAALPTAGQPARPVSNILVAPDETGAGVPLAADGRHFAAEAAQGAAVAKGQRVAGFPDGTRVLEVAIRDGDGRLLQAGAVDAACLALAEAEAAQGRVVLMHRVDLSKTGLLAPGLDALEDLQARLGDRLQVAVDACQARLDRRRVQADLARDWMVMITGSKFFTGPPFCGALLLPRLLTRRLAEASPGALPAGLGDYGGRTDWPAAARAADALPMRPNAGLLLRWQAALAEMQAFSEVTDADASRWTAAFVAGVQSVLDASPDLLPVMVPAPFRRDLTIIDGAGKPLPCWDQIQTIRSFLVLAAGSGARPPLDMEQARRIYRWLNADVTRALPEHASVEDRAHARLLCHIGQPAPVAHDALDGRMAGALRISVGARLLSGEPSHAGLGTPARLAREIADVGRIAAQDQPAAAPLGRPRAARSGTALRFRCAAAPPCGSRPEHLTRRSGAKVWREDLARGRSGRRSRSCLLPAIGIWVHVGLTPKPSRILPHDTARRLSRYPRSGARHHALLADTARSGRGERAAAALWFAGRAALSGEPRRPGADV